VARELWEREVNNPIKIRTQATMNEVSTGENRVNGEFFSLFPPFSPVQFDKPINHRKDTTMKTTRTQNLLAAALTCALLLPATAVVAAAFIYRRLSPREPGAGAGVPAAALPGGPKEWWTKAR
jgi:hypothetical protein